MILVAGGTGRLGTVLVRQLVIDGQPTRVLTRDPRRAAHLTGVELAVGDVRDPASLAPAMSGVRTVVSAVHGFLGPGRVTPASVDRDGNANLITAAAATGAHVVLMSVLGASADHPMELFRMKAAAEHLLRRSGLPWTIVRAGAFLELYQQLLQRAARRSGRPVIFGRGDNPITFTAVADVAAAIRRAITDPDCRATTLEVAGPTLTFNQLAATMTDVLGPGAAAPRHLPRPLLRLLASAGSTTPARQATAALIMDTHPLTHPISRSAAEPAPAPATGKNRS